MKSVIIVGAGGFGREVFQWACDIWGPDSVKGFLSPNAQDLDGFKIDKPILGSEESYTFDADDRFLLAVGSPKLRRIISNKIASKGGTFINLIHPAAQVSQLAQIGNGNIICPFSLVSPNAFIGDFCVLNFYCSVAHDAQLGNYTVMSPYSTLNGHSKTGAEVFLGTGASLAPKVFINSYSKISAGIALTRSLEEEYTFVPPSDVKVLKGMAKLFP
ncbi:acetyltransferase [Bdellovibrio sp. HCB185ZH]|uniref:acetyltransferase n=1 Tax=Bdellovibrio sp. HCB185ZH TaxID=3394235 RepID=UPI0039A51189